MHEDCIFILFPEAARQGASYENRLLLTLMHKIADFHAPLCPQRRLILHG